jgi:uncharacterized protein (DUF1330 family)
MSGYVLADVSWADEDARKAYMNLLGPGLEAYGGVVTTRSQDVHVMEGDWQPAGVIVLISFPAVKDALAWYHSEEYRPALEIRKRSCSSRLLIFGE